MPDRWILAALVVALGMTGGSVYMSVGLKMKACPLCLYERTFVMAAAAALLMGIAFKLHRTERDLGLVVLPLAVAGLALAGFHVFLHRSGVLDCPAGLFALGSAPEQSLAGFTLLTFLLCGTALGNTQQVTHDLAAVSLTALIGGVLAFACIKSAPPLPPPSPTYSPTGQRILSGCEPAVRTPAPGPS